MNINLTNISTRSLLEELFNRYKEAVFIGHANDRVNPLQMACHMPKKSTGMHSVLTNALEKLLTDIKRTYPDTGNQVGNHSGHESDLVLVR